MRTHEKALNILLNDLTFGVEIECLFPKIIARSLGISVNSSNWRNLKSMDHIADLDGDSLKDWEAGYDSTISEKQGYMGIEFSSKILQGEQGLKSVVKFFKWLDFKGAEVNASCGLHIHVGLQSMCNGQSVDEIIETILRTMKFANSIKTTMFAQSGSAKRYLNTNYAMPRVCKSLAIEEAENNRVPIFSCSKYTFINTHRSRENGVQSNKATIEFRAFAGTTQYNKVLMHLLTAFICVHAGMTNQRQSWDGKFKTADQGDVAFNTFVKNLSSKKNKFHAVLKQFPTFVENKRAMFSIGRKMASKFAVNIQRAVARSNGTLDLTRFV